MYICATLFYFRWNIYQLLKQIRKEILQFLLSFWDRWSIEKLLMRLIKIPQEY